MIIIVLTCIEVYQSSRFEKAFKRLTKEEQDSVDEETDRIIANPEIGERKKGDLSYQWGNHSSKSTFQSYEIPTPPLIIDK